jgi:hypothetical protein
VLPFPPTGCSGSCTTAAAAAAAALCSHGHWRKHVPATTTPSHPLPAALLLLLLLLLHCCRHDSVASLCALHLCQALPRQGCVEVRGGAAPAPRRLSGALLFYGSPGLLLLLLLRLRLRLQLRLLQWGCHVQWVEEWRRCRCCY